MQSIKFKEERATLVENMEAILEGAQKEKRDLTEEEQNNWNAFDAEITAIDNKIEMAERQEELNKSIAANISSAKSKETPKEYKNYSFLKAVNEFSKGGRLTGLEAEMDKEARNSNSGIVGFGVPTQIFGSEQRATPQTTANASEFIPVEVGDFVGTLQAKTVLGDLATWISGLSGDVKLPVLSGSTATWEGENDPAAEAGTAVGGPTLQPQRLASYMDISKQLLIQTNNSIERAIRDDIIGAVAAAVEAAALGEDAGAGNIPAGVFNNTVGTQVGVAQTLSRDLILSIEAALATANSDFGKLCWITNPAGREQLKAILGDPTSGTAANGLTSGSSLWTGDNRIIGYDAKCTSNVPATLGAANNENGLILGRWDDLVIGQFGSALDVLVDPYTQAASGAIRIVLNSYWDTAVRRQTSFQYIGF
tara:strand:+ start:1170 stop:2438 length:1269 start_codon:yes stop_codon:yes gene_type:complete